MDIYKEIDSFSKELAANNYQSFAEALKNAKFSGSVASEILGLVSLELRKFIPRIKKEDQILLSKATDLLKAIERVLK